MARSLSNCQSTVDFVGVDGSRPPASIVPRSPHPVIRDRRVPRASVGVASWSETATSGSGIDHCVARSGTGGGCALLERGASRGRQLNIGAPGQSTCHHEFVRSRRAGILGLLLFAAPSVWARPASARASARLVYILGPGSEPCPGAKALRAAVGMRLGYDPFLDGADDLVVAEVSRQNDVYRLRVRLLDEHDQPVGSRELSLRADSCSAVIDAMALTISLAIDASFRDDASPDPAPTVAPTAPVSAPLETDPRAASAMPVSEPPPPSDRASRVRFHTGLVGIAAAGFAPAPNAGIVLLVGGRWRIVSIDLEGRADLPATGASDDPRVRLRSRLVLGSAVPCVHSGPGMVCAVVSAGRLDATAVGVPFPNDSSAFWWGVGTLN
jgi:hypothetical protein